MLHGPVSAPIYRLLLPFAVGIILNNFLPTQGLPLINVLIGLIGFLCITPYLPLRWKWKFSPAHGIVLLLVAVVLGAIYSTWRDHRRASDWIGYTPTQKKFYLVQFRKELTRTRNGWRATADLIAQQEEKTTKPVSGGIFLYTKNDSILRSVIPGRKAWIHTRLKPIQNKPGSAFDYERYCLRNKITHQGYLSKTSDITSSESNPWSIPFTLHVLRMHVKNILYEKISDTVNAGLASALFIGWKGGLDPQLKEQYTQTGTIHIIAISGLHISLVFEILWRLLYPLLFLRGGQTLRTLITLGSIWIFCFLAGGEASVLRAGIMFTAVHAGRWLERPVSGIQALGLSMFTLLLADPDWLFDPGFQLSHGAVMGILTLQPILAKCITLKNPLLRSVWESSTLTITATIGTLPFTAYYFHQFPLTFLPANLLAVPLSSIVLMALFMLIPFHPVTILGNTLATCIDWLLDGMNSWIEHLARIPGTVWAW